MDHGEQAKNFFLAGANCAQAVAMAFAEDCNLDQETLMRIASGFGGGIARQREVCGAVSGMVMAAGLLLKQDTIQDKSAKDACYTLIRHLCDEFRKENGSIICRELLGLAPQTVDQPISEARTASYYKKRPCAELVAAAASILEREVLKK